MLTHRDRLARQDRWEEALRVLATVRSLSATHRYVATEMQQITDQLEEERQMIGGMGFKSLMKEMWTIPGNRRRALLSVGVMISQQMTGTNAVYVSHSRTIIVLCLLTNVGTTVS